MKAKPLLLLSSLLAVQRIDGLSIPTPSKLTKSVSDGFKLRIAADPSFTMKSATELVLAAGTQFSAELNRRGASSLLVELDFVIAGILTAMIGKYYSMWRVAPTRVNHNDDGDKSDKTVQDQFFAKTAVPTNAFQATMLDGVTKPVLKQRLLSFIAPMQSLFQAGIIASSLGYGVTAAMIAIRTFVVPSYVAATRSVNILSASVYTGVFMAFVSNIRYQVLQGLIEPKLIDKVRRFPVFHSFLLFAIRTANGFLGSLLAIMGMRYFGLQKMK